MPLGTYSELKTSIADHLDRDDLANQIDDFIDLAEARHKRDIRIRDMVTRASLTINARLVSLPTGYLQAQVVRILTDANSTDVGDNVLREVNFYEMTRLRLADINTDRPKFFTAQDQIEFDVVPDQSYTGEIIYYAELTALSDSNTSNALLTRAPDAYLYGALVASAPFLMHDERIQIWGDLYAVARDSLNKLDLDARHNGPLVSRIDGTTP